LNARQIVLIITLVAVICSTLGVVYAKHESRRSAVQLGMLEDQRDEIIAEWSRLQLEQAWLADASHVESKAREQLGMELPAKSMILIVEKP